MIDATQETCEAMTIIERLRSVEIFISTSGNISPVAHEAAALLERAREVLIEASDCIQWTPTGMDVRKHVKDLLKEIENG